MLVSLIIPAYNEEFRISATIHSYTQALAEYAPDQYEIIVVANGCKDRTVEVVKQLASDVGRIRVHTIEASVGKGGAILAGFTLARGEYVAFADADCSTSSESLIKLLEELRNADVVIGSRHMAGSAILTPQPFKRRVLGRFFNAAVRYCFRLPYHDTQCGAKAFHRDVAFYLAQHVQEYRWTFDVDVLLWARAQQLVVIERPVIWQDSSGSKVATTAVSWEVLQAFWRMYLTHMRPSTRQPSWKRVI